MDFDFFNAFEIDLTGVCQLKCDRCSRNYKHSQHLAKLNIRPLNEIKNQLDQFKNLKFCFLAGQTTEPTTYPYLIDFLKYLKTRDIRVELYTNASKLNTILFKRIGDVLTLKDAVHFTICGSTQEIHEIYRKGSTLSNILNNAEALRKSKPIDYLQYIRFKHNLNDWRSNNWKNFNFTHTYWVESEGPRLFNECIKPIKSIPVKQRFYEKIFNYLKTHNNLHIECESLESTKCYIDQFGKVYPCYMIAEYFPEMYFDNFNYSKCNFLCCKLCSKESKDMMKKYGLDFLC